MPVTDIDKFVDFLEQRPSSGLQRRQVRFWKDSLDPLEHAVSVDIPILLVRGSAGNSEDPLGADRYVALLRQNGISHADVELDQVIDAYELLSESNRLRFMNVVLEFLSGSCG